MAAKLLLSLIAIMATPALAAADRLPTYSVVDRIPGPDGGWDFVDVDPTHHRIYIARCN